VYVNVLQRQEKKIQNRKIRKSKKTPEKAGKDKMHRRVAPGGVDGETK
jgi:hypothetical protein